MVDFMRRVPPHAVDAEVSVLGAILLKSHILPRVSAVLDTEDFYIEKHRQIFEAMLHLDNRRVEIDAVTLTDVLKSRGHLENIGGVGYIAELAATVPTTANVDYYAQIVRSKAILRALSTAATEIAARAYETIDTDMEKFLLESESMIASICQRRLGTAPKSFDDRINDVLAQVNRPVDVRQVSTGFENIDHALQGGLRRGDLVVLAARPSMGKAQPLDAMILTPSGFMPMRDMQIGTKVIGRDGRSHRIAGVFPQGEKEVFEVEFSDGTKTECCDDHLWLTSTRNERRARRRTSWSVKPLSEIRNSLIRPDSSKTPNHAIPLLEPVEFGPVEALFPIHPRLLGLLLGDGSLHGNIRFDKPEADVLASVRELLPEGDDITPTEIGVRIRRAKRNNDISETRKALEQLGLWGLYSEERFIPVQYLFAPIEARWALLSGLCDTDGSVAGSGIEFGSSSKKLALDVAFLARSLGAIVAISDRIPTFTYNGEKKAGLRSYRLLIRFPNGEIPARSAKHLAKWHVPSRFHHRSIVKVTSKGRKECQCISVDAPDGLYVTDDFIVTHNTALALNFCTHLSRGGSLFLSVEMRDDQLIERALSDLAGVSWREIELRKEVWESEAERLAFAGAKLGGMNLEVLKRRQLKPREVRREAILAAHKWDGKLDLVVVDYLQLMKPDEKQDTKNYDIAEITGALKDLAEELDCAVLLLSQLSREVNKRAGIGQPMLEDLRDSGAVEQDADVVMFLWQRQEKDQPRDPNGPVELTIAKHRNGPLGTLELDFDRAHTRFRERRGI